MALLMGACPKRQSGPRLVYVPTPPSATSTAPAPNSDTLIIEEPASVEPEAGTPAKPVAQTAAAPKSPPRNNRKTASPPEPASAEPMTGEAPPVDVPALEAPNVPGQARLREQTEAMQREVSQRLAQFRGQPLSDTEAQTLAEAKAFLEQSLRALRADDLLRSYNLAHKASLLITAFEQRH